MDVSVKQEYRTGRNKIHPQIFALLVACASIVMMFAGLTSAYLVRKAAGNWLEFQLPGVFNVSTIVILLSSLCLHFSYVNFKKGKERLYKLALLATALLGLTFIVLQYQGWEVLSAQGVSITVNPSSSFVYLISGLHAAHILGGLAALTVALIHAFSLPFKPTQKRKLRFELTLIYWHFVDLLWFYLYGFLLIQQG